ncbi:hypothetical protein [Methylobacterium sp. A54F]
MTASQREALLGLMDAILAVDYCPPNLVARAQALRTRVVFGAAFDSLFG